jgi:biotin-dependent carboxylase-like uncharacterized protein
MDYQSFLLSNVLLNNDKNSGALEFAYQGPLLKLIKGKTKIAIAGNVFFKIYSPKGEITGEPYRTYNLNEGDQLDILATKASVYGYLSIEGGFKLDKFCGSVSSQPRAFIGPNDGKKIELKDKILIFKNSTTNENKIIRNIKFEEKKIFSVLPGPQFHYFSTASKKQFFSTPYLITKQTDRMGMRVIGKSLENLVNSNIPSEGIIKGAIQVPGDGNPIILLSDHPTTGGYPKVGSIISADYDDLIQQNANREIYFQLVTLEAAEQRFTAYMEKIKKRITNIEIV